MSSINMVTLLGRVGKDPEIRKSGSGKLFANLSLATSEKWKDNDGNTQEDTEWHRVIFIGPVSEVVEKYVTKGSQICVVGKIKSRKWTDAHGIEKTVTEIIVDVRGQLTLCGGQQTQ